MGEARKMRFICRVCGEVKIGAVLGKDMHYVKARNGEERFYCEKCMKKLMRGEI